MIEMIPSFIPVCKYCLSEDEKEDFISPCKCIGSCNYVHRKCLITWLYKKIERPPIPGYFVDEKSLFSCELCKTPYKIVTSPVVREIRLVKKVIVDAVIYITLYTLLLLASYVIFGWIFTFNNLLVYDFGGYWENIFGNGFLVTHIIIGVYYLLCLCSSSCSSSRSSVYFINGGSSCNNEFEIVLFIIFLVVMSVLGTIFTIYYDLLKQIKEREKQRGIEILDIQTYVEPDYNC
jgi:hypothetical protein